MIKLFLLLFFDGSILFFAIIGGLLIDEFVFIYTSQKLANNVNELIMYVLALWMIFDIFLFRRKIQIPIFCYLTTPISRYKLTKFYQLITIFGKLNIAFLTFVTMFWIKNFYIPEVSFSWNWLLLFYILFVCFISIGNVFRFLRIEKYSIVLYILLIVMVISIILEWIYNISILSNVSIIFFGKAIQGVFWPIIISILAVVSVLYISGKNISHNMYIDNMQSFMGYQKQTRRFEHKMISNKLFHSINIEWKLVIRNRNTRLVPILSTIWLLSVILIPINPTFIHVIFLILSISFYTVQSFNYKSIFYDGLLSKPISYIDLIKNAYTTSILLMSIIFCIAILTYVILKIYAHILLTICLFIYGSGVSIYLFIFLGMFDIRRTELNSSSFHLSNFSSEKVRFAFLPMILIFLPPSILILSIPDILYASISIGIIGIGGLIFRVKWMSFLAYTLQRRRYIMLEEFRHR